MNSLSFVRMHHPQCVKKKKEKKKERIQFFRARLQCRSATSGHVLGDVGYVGALQQPIPRAGLKDRSLYIKERERK